MVTLIAVGPFEAILKGLKRELKQLEIWGKLRPTSVVKIGQNSEKSPWHLRRFDVTQTPVKAHYITLMKKKKSPEVKKIIKKQL